MSAMPRSYSIFFLAAFFSSLQSYGIANKPPPETVSFVDLNRYMGAWYEIARLPFTQQEGCYNTTAKYSLNPNGTVKVINRCRKGGFEGPESTAIAKAKVADTVSNAKLKVKFFVLAPWGDYWIIRLGKDYEYAVVSQPDRKYLWILSRNATMEAGLYEDIVKSLEADHFNVALLEKTPQQWGDFSGAPANVLMLITPYLNSLPLAIGLMTLVWLLSLALRDASIVDRFWGLGFIALTLQQTLQSRFLTFRAGLILVLVILWGMRLSLYIHFRNRRKPEDARYQKMRQAGGPSFWWKSFFFVFILQGLLMWFISAPLAVIHLFPQADEPTLLDLAGILLFMTGFLFESVGDYQLSRFKRDPFNQGKVCRVGLWNLSRHPNYFGESLVWWGFFLISLNAGYGWATALSPILMTYLLLKVSGVALLEKQLKSTKLGYAEYLDEVPAFFPVGRIKCKS